MNQAIKITYKYHLMCINIKHSQTSIYLYNWEMSKSTSTSKLR
jgi:hypothetical protein